MRLLKSVVGALTLASVLYQTAAAQDTFSGSVTLETRAFPNTALFSEQHGALVSVTAEPRFFFLSESGAHTLTFSPFGRIDSGDSERTHFDIRELYWQTYGDRWELSAGLLWTFWGVTESQHLVDVINQTDLVENPDGEDKLGQPAVQGTWLADWGTIDLFLLPYFRERTFPGVDGRLRFPIPVDTDAAEVERTLGVAARWFHTLGSLDLGLSTFFGTAREPRLRVISDGGPPTAVVPLYERIHQVGVDAQLISGSWLWKFEGITRSGQGDRFFSTVAGFEYTLANMKNSGADLGLIAEYNHDTRGPAGSADEPLSLSFFDNDLFMGGRLALNDVQSSELLGGAVVDVELGTVSWLIEASRRVGSTFTADLEVRAFSNVDPTDPVYSLRRDSFVQLGFSFFY
ncbi:MAG: hypothetical protein ACR2QM_07740 [Longimicrobiales bacterium]